MSHVDPCRDAKGTLRADKEAGTEIILSSLWLFAALLPFSRRDGNALYNTGAIYCDHLLLVMRITLAMNSYILSSHR